MPDSPETPADDLPQDPGTSALPDEEPPPEGSLESPEEEKDQTGTDARGRAPRHRAD